MLACDGSWPPCSESAGDSVLPNMRERPRTTVYVPCHNYGRYLPQALDSVFSQICRDWELVVLIDGCTDDSLQIAEKYRESDAARVRIEVNPEPQGLRSCANRALELARGRYIVRLDADDFFDQAALLVLGEFLDAHPEVALVYPNWTFVNEDGVHLGVEYRKLLGAETDVLDLPPHGAGTMVRTRVLKSVGGYDTHHDAQDGHELWLKVLHRYKVANVSTPLFFYRQHSESLSKDDDRLLASRQQIKRSIVEASVGPVRPCSVAIVPAKNTYLHLPNVALNLLAGKALIDYTIEAALQVGAFQCVYVFTDDPRVVEHCDRLPGVISEIRPAELSSERATLAEIVNAAVARLESRHDIHPDIVATLSVHTPLRRPEHIREAVDTLLLYDVETVVSTYEDLDLHFMHGMNGMQPLNPGMINRVRFEREALYVGNGSIHVTWRDWISPESLFRGRIGHIVMPRHASHHIKSPEDLAVVTAILEARVRSAEGAE